MTAPVKARLFVAADLAAGLAVDLPADQAHYLRNVLRLAVGDAVALFNGRDGEFRAAITQVDKKACRLQVGERSEEHTSELQSLMRISYAVFCLKKKNNRIK